MKKSSKKQPDKTLLNAIVGQGTKPATEFRPHPKNAREHPAKQYEVLKESIEQDGFRAPIIENRRTGFMIDGHLRLKVVMECFPELAANVPFIQVDYSVEQESRALATHDLITQLATWNPASFDSLLRDFQTTSQSMADMLSKHAKEIGLYEEQRKNADSDVEYKSEFSVLIKCADEREQIMMIEELQRHELDVKAMVVDFPVVETTEPTPGPDLKEGEIEIIRKTNIKRTPRVIQIEGMFDVPPNRQAVERWRCHIKLDRPWNIGLIVGPSGSGKTTLAKELFGRDMISGWDWKQDQAIVDGFPEGIPIAEITAILSSVGFSSPPSWLKPFGVLSNGEQFRVNLARTLAEKPDLAVMDEFTSVVDRTVAKIGSAALAKSLRMMNKKFIAVSCHCDIEEWLQPDWVIEMPLAKLTWRSLRRRPPIQLEVHAVDGKKWWSLFGRHHYLSHTLHRAAACFLGKVDGRPAVFTSVMYNTHPAGSWWREHRTVCLPDFQGVGIGNAMSELIAACFRAKGDPYRSTTSHPAMIRHRMRSPLWRCVRKPSMNVQGQSQGIVHGRNRRAQFGMQRYTAGFEYIGEPKKTEAQQLGII